VHADPWLRRIERTSIAACLVMAAGALVISRRLAVAAGVVGGGLLIAVSYRAIASGVNGLVDALGAEIGAERPRRSPPGWARPAVALALRYALLAVLAYVMIARLRLHPVGLLVGASSVVAAASVEALRLLLKK
jgi:hypothetical protein